MGCSLVDRENILQAEGREFEANQETFFLARNSPNLANC